MSRGGKRQNAGRKTSWVSGCRFEDTKVIRVPEIIADQVLKYAHQLDAMSVSKEVLSPKMDVLEKVTNSKREAPVQLDLLCQSSSVDIYSLNQALLSDRLGISASQIRKSKGKRGDKALQSWSSQYDPDGISWKYDSSLKLYKPYGLDMLSQKAFNLANWLKSKK